MIKSELLNSPHVYVISVLVSRDDTYIFACCKLSFKSTEAWKYNYFTHRHIKHECMHYSIFVTPSCDRLTKNDIMLTDTSEKLNIFCCVVFWNRTVRLHCNVKERWNDLEKEGKNAIKFDDITRDNMTTNTKTHWFPWQWSIVRIISFLYLCHYTENFSPKSASENHLTKQGKKLLHLCTLSKTCSTVICHDKNVKYAVVLTTDMLLNGSLSQKLQILIYIFDHNGSIRMEL